MTRPRAADDFTAIHARMEELRRERELPGRKEAEDNLKARKRRLPLEEIARAAEQRLWRSVK